MRSHSSGIVGRRFTSDGAPNGGEFPVNTNVSNDQRNPDLDMDQEGNFVVVWESFQNGSFDVVGRRFASQRFADVGVRSDGAFVVVWSSYGEDGLSKGCSGAATTPPALRWQRRSRSTSTPTALRWNRPSGWRTTGTS